jgi:hypothetical protein
MDAALQLVSPMPDEPPMRGKLWQPTPGRARNDSELRMEALLNRLGIAHQYEDRFFSFADPKRPLPSDEGVAPDYRVVESSLYAEQWIEVTAAKNKNILRRKRQKIAKALRRWGVRILLVDGELLTKIERDPAILVDLLLPAFELDRCPLPPVYARQAQVTLAVTS